MRCLLLLLAITLYAQSPRTTPPTVQSIVPRGLARGMTAELQTFAGQPDWPTGLHFSPDGKTLRVARLDGSTQTYPIP